MARSESLVTPYSLFSDHVCLCQCFFFIAASALVFISVFDVNCVFPDSHSVIASESVPSPCSPCQRVIDLCSFTQLTPRAGWRMCWWSFSLPCWPSARLPELELIPAAVHVALIRVPVIILLLLVFVSRALHEPAERNDIKAAQQFTDEREILAT